MTTSASPLAKLKAQADQIATRLKGMVSADPATLPDKVRAALDKPAIKFGIVMDDKIITVEMPWATIRETDEAGISAWIVEHMRGKTIQPQ